MLTDASNVGRRGMLFYSKALEKEELLSHIPMGYW